MVRAAAAITITGGQPLQTYNVLSYNPNANDGVTNAVSAIRSAYNAAVSYASGSTGTNGRDCRVYFPPGTYLVDQTAINLTPFKTNDWWGQTSPTWHRNGHITFSGYGATIKYKADTPTAMTARYSWMQAIVYPYSAGLYTTYGNLTIEGLTTDPNWRTPSADCGQLIWAQCCANFSDMHFIDCTVPNHSAWRTEWNSNRTCEGIVIHGWPERRDQAHVGYMDNISVEGGTYYGSTKPITILVPYFEWTIDGVVYRCDEPLAWNPYTQANIVIDGCTLHNKHSIGTGVHLGSYASGISCSITNVDTSDSTDNLIELDAFDNVYIAGCTMRDGASAIGITWFSYPFSASDPVHVVENCVYEGGGNAYWPIKNKTTNINYTVEPGSRSCQAFSQVTLGAAPSQLRGRSWGHFTFRNCTANLYNADDPYHPERYWTDYTKIPPGGVDMWIPQLKVDSPFSSVTYDNVRVTDTGPKWNSTAPYAVLYQRSPGSLNAPVYIRNVLYRNTLDGSYVKVPKTRWTVSPGLTNIDSDISLY